MPIDYSEYHPEWKTRIRPAIMERAGHRCEGSPKFPDCRAQNYKPHPDTGSKVILTIAHLDQDITNNDYTNLKALCQRCHLAHDQESNIAKRKYGKKHERKHQQKLF